MGGVLFPYSAIPARSRPKKWALSSPASKSGGIKPPRLPIYAVPDGTSSCYRHRMDPRRFSGMTASMAAMAASIILSSGSFLP